MTARGRGEALPSVFTLDAGESPAPLLPRCYHPAPTRAGEDTRGVRGTAVLVGALAR